MKTLSLILFLLLLAPASQGLTYYVSQGGNDSNNGTSPATPWQTISKVNSINFAPGDSMLFRRGDTWLNESHIVVRSGNASAQVTYGAYGSGQKPIIRKHRDVTGWNVEASWTQSGNAWYMTYGDTYRLWIDGVEVKKKEALPVNASNKFYCSGGLLYVYSATNPATTFTSMKDPGSIYIILGSGASYVTLSNLDLQGAGNAVIRIQGGHHWIIEGCNIGRDCSANGISANARNATDPANYGIVRNCTFDPGSAGTWGWEAKYTGDGILLSYGCSGWDIYDNYFTDWGHNSIGLINMNGDTYTMVNNKFHHNFCTSPNIDYGRGWGYSSSFMSDTGNEIYANVFYNMGCMSQVNGPNLKVYCNIFNKVRSIPYRLTVAQGLNFDGYSSGIPQNCQLYNNLFAYCENTGIQFGLATAGYEVQNNLIRNNIVYECDNVYNYAIKVSNSPYCLGNTWQNNMVYRAGVTNVFSYKNATLNVSGFNALNGVEGNVISGNRYADPLFVDPLNGNFHLQAESPALHAGMPVGLTTDLAGVEVRGNPSIGPYEIPLTGSLPVFTMKKIVQHNGKSVYHTQ